MADRIKIEINTENDAFAENPNAEIVRILKNLVSAIENWDLIQSCTISDVNGNRCGSIIVESI